VTDLSQQQIIEKLMSVGPEIVYHRTWCMVPGPDESTDPVFVGTWLGPCPKPIPDHITMALEEPKQSLLVVFVPNVIEASLQLGYTIGLVDGNVCLFQAVAIAQQFEVESCEFLGGRVYLMAPYRVSARHEAAAETEIATAPALTAALAH
jgi:hypothetical protein